MARKKKSNSSTLKQTFQRDRNFFTAIHSTGLITKDYYKNIGVTESRVNTYNKCKYIEKVSDTNGKYGWKLTKEGKEFAEKTWSLSKNESYPHQSYNHDVKLQEEYFKTDHDKYEWKTESQVRDMFRDKISEIREQDYDRAEHIQKMWDEKLISMPDACIIERETGVEIYIEVITNSYGEQELQSKERMVEIMNAQYKPIRA